MTINKGSTMKRITYANVFAFAIAALAARASDPQLDSWFTAYSGQYARLYATDADKNSGNAVATWSRGTLSQTTPVYAGVHEVYSSPNWVYLRTSGLGP